MAIEASQRIMHNLRPAILEQGLLAALQWMAARFERRTGVICVLRVPQPAPRQMQKLPAGVPLVAYRTAQEALTNITKHAQASKVQIDLALAGGVLSLEISDNGRGFGRHDLAKIRSFGIRGLHEHARARGGLGGHQQRPRGHDADPVSAVARGACQRECCPGAFEPSRSRGSDRLGRR